MKELIVNFYSHCFSPGMMLPIQLINQFVLLHLRVLIGPHIISSQVTSQLRCNMPQKFMPVKEKQRRKVGGHKLVN